MANEIKQLHADIIALQEVDNGLPRSRFVNQAKAIAQQIGMNYVYSPAIHFPTGTYGNALLSRFPISLATTVQLPSMHEPRALLDATLDINGIP
ncbi:endonuclease/exonuclease/phosphatase family protein, partial [Microbacteriaceae bacterium K1510]|nr:endonuclease/exonuclease/phosphatase family protein [Microbacteriaceae bacterium K1510]